MLRLPNQDLYVRSYDIRPPSSKIHATHTHWQPLPRGQLHDALTVQHRKSVSQYDHPFDLLSRSRSEGLLQFIPMLGCYRRYGHAKSMGNRRRLLEFWFCRWLLRIVDNADAAAFGKCAAQQLESLSGKVGGHVREPVRFPPGRARPATTPCLSGSPRNAMTIGMVVVACFAAHTAGPKAAIHRPEPRPVRRPVPGAGRSPLFCVVGQA